MHDINSYSPSAAYVYSGMYNWHQIGFHQSEQKAKTSDLPKSAIHKSYVCNGI
jgi:hypothetical protein